MPKLTDAELARQWAIRIMKAAREEVAFDSVESRRARAVAQGELIETIEKFVETIDGKKVV